MSKAYIASTTSVNPPKMQEYKLINRPTTENEIGTIHIVDVRNKRILMDGHLKMMAYIMILNMH